MKITYKVLLILVVTVFGLLSITTSFELNRLRRQFESESHGLHRTIAANLVDNLSAALFNVDKKRITRQIQSAFQFGQINRIIVLDDTAKPLGAFQALSRADEPQELTAERAEDLGLDPLPYQNPRQEYKDQLIDTIETEPLSQKGTQRLTTTLWFSDDDRRIFVGHLLVEFDNRAVESVIQQAIRDKLISAFFLASIMCGLTFLVLQFVVLRRLDALKASVKSIQARDYSQPIAVHGRDEIGVLAQAFRNMVTEIQAYQEGLEAKVQERTRDLQKSRDKIKTILDNIEQGIVTFSADFKFDSEYSRKTLEILNTTDAALRQHTVVSGIIEPSQLSQDRIDQIHETLKCTLEASEVSWMANYHALPTELEYRAGPVTKILGLEWVPLMQVETATVERVLLTIRDLSQVRFLEQQRQTEADQNDRILTLVKIIRQIGHSRIQAFLQNSLISLEKASSQIQDKTAGLILLHTLKGEARTLQMQSLAEAVHDAEALFKNGDNASLLQSLETLDQTIRAWHDVLKMLSSDEPEARPTFMRTVAQVVDEVANRAYQAGIPHGEIQIASQVEAWDPRLLDGILSPCLTHALNNALDHGYIFPEHRHQEHRPLRLSIRAWQESRTIVMEVKDEGYGVDADLVLRTAQARGLAIAGLSVEEILFLPEFSTAATASGTSGRGVGMSAIRKLVESCGGELKLESRPGHGSTLTVRIPMDAGLSQVA